MYVTVHVSFNMRQFHRYITVRCQKNSKVQTLYAARDGNTMVEFESKFLYHYTCTVKSRPQYRLSKLLCTISLASPTLINYKLCEVNY